MNIIGHELFQRIISALRYRSLRKKVEAGTYDCWLRPADRPIVNGLENYEVVFAKDQPEYAPLRALTSRNRERRVMSRWTLTDEQRRAIAAGADVFLILMTFGTPLQPIQMMVAPEIQREYVIEEFGFNPETAEKLRAAV